ncbi:MAG: hypothetical protein AVDCRST_MAG64-1178, partial [uncultured Phycisphaerae bacterium]
DPARGHPPADGAEGVRQGHERPDGRRPGGDQ